MSWDNTESVAVRHLSQGELISIACIAFVVRDPTFQLFLHNIAKIALISLKGSCFIS